MTIGNELLSKLACPKCVGPLELGDEGRALDCRACSIRYEIRDGIPALIPELGQPLPAGQARPG